MVLTPELASKFARLALAHLTREYPHKMDHVLNAAGDLRPPRELHPVFYGSFDWHSCVHGYWLLATLLRRFPSLPEAQQINTGFDAQFTDPHIAAEVRYLEQPLRATFERTYGWAWLLMLAAELARHETAAGKRWRRTLQPLTDAFVDRFRVFLRKAHYPIRVGTHFNSAFAVSLALEYAIEVGDKDFQDLLVGTALRWFNHDIDCQAWEPGGDDFLSSALMEAECMRRVHEPDGFRDAFSYWLSCFLPHLGEGQPHSLFDPAIVSDRTDGKIAHLDGLNLSRAWCWRSLAKTFPESDKRQLRALDAAQKHLDAGLPHVAGDYMGEHWLATFALLALTE